MKKAKRVKKYNKCISAQISPKTCVDTKLLCKTLKRKTHLLPRDVVLYRSKYIKFLATILSHGEGLFVKSRGNIEINIIHVEALRKKALASKLFHLYNDYIGLPIGEERCVMDYRVELKLHFRPKRGWINDPNGLSYYKGYYHVFFQYAPDYEVPWKESMHWGHARTKDFLVWEELPVALKPDEEYDREGCWSGTAIVRDGRLYLFYASIRRDEEGRPVSTVSVAVSEDGVNFSKLPDNPLIDRYPEDGGPDFRDPAVCKIGDEYYCVMATGNPESRTGRLLLYKSADLERWDYIGILKEWSECEFTECPSLVATDGGYLLGASVCPLESARYYNLSKEKFENGRFFTEFSAEVDKGPDQYAGQIFRDDKGRNILITWVSGWQYQYPDRCIGCMSCPREITCEGGVLRAYPVEELRPYLKDSDEALVRTENGFRIERTGREPVVYEGEIRDLKILRDGYVLEVFVNGGEEVYTAIL